MVNLKVKKILIVDDESSVRYTVKTGLETIDEDYQVITVESGMECLNYLNNNAPPDVILLDVMMPEMSGWETLDKIRDNTAWKNIPILFLTGRTDKIAKNAEPAPSVMRPASSTSIASLQPRLAAAARARMLGSRFSDFMTHLFHRRTGWVDTAIPSVFACVSSASFVTVRKKFGSKFSSQTWFLIAEPLVM